MAVVKIEGKEVTLDDDVVKAGDKAIRAVLAANGFPAVENAHIEIVGGKGGAPAIVSVSPRSTGKGSSASLESVVSCGSTVIQARRADPADEFLAALEAAPDYINPAIDLAVRVLAAESQGDTELFIRAHRSGEVERAVAEGQREGRGVWQMLRALGFIVPTSSKRVPVGF